MKPAVRLIVGIAGVLVALGVSGGQSWGTSISIINPGFESNVLADLGAVALATGWGIAPSNSGGTFNPSVVQFPGQAPEGQNTAFSNGGTISQILSATLLANTNYTLRVEIGDRLDTVLPGYAVELRAGGNLLASESSLSPANGTFLTSTINFFSGANPNVGQALEIRLLSSGVQTNYDNVRLDTTIPEPATWLLLGSGLAGLAAWRRMRKS